MFDGRWRHGVDRATGPIGRVLVRFGVNADVLTASGLGFSLLTAVVVASGHLRWGIPLLTLTGANDLFDGPVAKLSGSASRRGAFFDSVADRVSDAIIMGGVAWYLVGLHEGELSLLPLCVLGAASTVSYTRAKAEALGFPKVNAGIAGSLMERAERMILLGVAMLSRSILVPALWVLFVLTAVTAVARFVSVWKVAERPSGVASGATATPAPHGGVAARQRRWRRSVHHGARSSADSPNDPLIKGG